MTTMSAEERTLPRLVQRAATLFGERTALQEEHQQISFNELEQRRRQSAKAFIAAGIEPGDRIAVWAPNMNHWILAAIGAQSVGGVLVPLNTRLKGSEAADILNRSGARLLFTVPEFQAGPSTTIRYLEMLASETLTSVERTILLRGQAQGASAWDEFIATGSAVGEAEVDARSEAVQPDDTMDMLFTSGTTGSPKGVMCSHGQNLQAFEVWADTVGLTSDDIYLIINPFFHSFGYKAGWLAGLIKGARVLPVPTFDLDTVLTRIHQDRVTMLPGPPTIYQSLLNHPERDRYDISSLRLAVTGAAAVPVELVRRMRSELGFETAVTAYGLTETCGVVTVCRADDDPETIANSSGCAIPGVEVACVDDDGNEVPRGEPGEIWVRGYNVMKEYFDNPEATREAITPEGWLRTGDVGVMDEHGYIRITDRLKDMFISGGFNVYPAEIESALMGLEGVAQAAVIGVPDERMGELGQAFIVRTADASLDEAQVLKWCRDNMANYKVPRSVVFLDALPLNASGKVVKPELRKMAQG